MVNLVSTLLAVFAIVMFISLIFTIVYDYETRCENGRVEYRTLGKDYWIKTATMCKGDKT